MDILGSLTQDIIPRFSLPPSTFLPDLKSFSSAKTQSRTQLFPLESINALHPNLNDVVAALKDLRSFTFMLQFELTRNPAKWQDNTVSSHYVDPIVHRLLSVRSKCHKLTQEFAIHEICRIGGLLYTSGIRRKFMIYPVHSGTLIQRLQDLLLSSETDIVPVQPILLWTLALAITETKDDEKRHFFIERLVSHLVAQGIASWNGVMAVLQSIMWMEDVFDAGLGGIEAPFRSIMHAQGG